MDGGKFFGSECPETLNAASKQAAWVRTTHGHLAPLSQDGDSHPVEVLTAGELIQDEPDYKLIIYRRLPLDKFYMVHDSDKGSFNFRPHRQFVFTPAGHGRFFIRENSTNRCLRSHENFVGWTSNGGRGEPEELPADLVDCTVGNASDTSTMTHLLWKWVPLKEQTKVSWASKLFQ
jgi:hypothetical protein